MGLLQDASLIVTPNAYKSGKLYSVVPSDGTGDFTVTRATSATRVNSAGLIETVGINIPRLDYTNASCPSILVEQQRTNLLLYSEDFDNISWVKANSSIVVNSTISPSGLMNADKLSETTATNNHGTSNLQTLAIGTVYTISVFVKKGTRRYVGLECFYNNIRGNIAFFDLNTNSLLYQFSQGAGYSITNSKIENYVNGWVRLSASVTFGDTAAYPGICLASTQWTTGTSYNNLYTGNVNEFIYVWGAQLEAGGNATSYIPTTTAAVTRNADVITKASATNLIGQTEGTIFWEGYIDASFNYPFFPRLLILGDGGLSTVVGILLTSNNVLRGQYINTLGIQAQISFSISGASKYYKIAFAYKENDFVLYVDGVNRGIDNLGTTSSPLNLIALGREDGLGSTPSIHPCKTAALWKTRLTDTQLQQLTTL